jgi:Biotin-requiring enzyme
MAESISEGTLKTWQKKVGDVVAADDEVATIETDKVCTALPFPSLMSPPPFFFLPPFIVASYFSVHFVRFELDSP